MLNLLIAMISDTYDEFQSTWKYNNHETIKYIISDTGIFLDGNQKSAKFFVHWCSPSLNVEE